MCNKVRQLKCLKYLKLNMFILILAGAICFSACSTFYKVWFKSTDKYDYQINPSKISFHITLPFSYVASNYN